MQIYYLHPSVYRLSNYAYRQASKEKYLGVFLPKVEAWEKLKEAKLAISLIKEFSGISRATYYRYG